MKEYKGFDVFYYILKNKDKALYNQKYDLKIMYSDALGQVVIYNKNSQLTDIKINDETLSLIWCTENRKKYCFRLYKGEKLNKVITQLCEENNLEKTMNALMNKNFCDKVKCEEMC